MFPVWLLTRVYRVKSWHSAGIAGFKSGVYDGLKARNDLDIEYNINVSCTKVFRFEIESL